ncbi:MAG: ABC transporter permease [Lactobacillus sp.]|jgi:putative ABC transport system permease protein|nr:ABC transporter permease [Lactobacillus sp.]
MFLAWKEIRHEKLRYGLIVFMIFLISFLILILSSLSVGLANKNTSALKSWHLQTVVLNKHSNVSLTQSLLTQDQLDQAKLSKKEAVVGQTPVAAKGKNLTTVSSQFIGLNKDEYIFKNLPITRGRKPKKDTEIVVDDAFAQKGYHLGDKIKLNDTARKYKIVGWVHHNEINIAPVVYGSLKTWKKLRNVMPTVAASGIVSKRNFKPGIKGTKSYQQQTFIQKLPGYRDQNMTFMMMIGFLFVISLIIVAVFLYILTMQKLPNFAVLRAQGIPSKVLVSATIWQSLILVLSGVVLGLAGLALSAKFMPAAVPMSFSPAIWIPASLGMVIMGLIGAVLPAVKIARLNPLSGIGG